MTSLGGEAKPAFDIMDQDRMAVCADPNGAGFDAWEPREMLGTDVDSTLHGAPSWFETMMTDLGRAAAFYSALFDWTPEATPMPEFEYTTFQNRGTDVACMTQIRPGLGNPRPHWETNFTVRDADEAAREAAKLGAKLPVPAQDVPGIGRFSGLTTPQGVTFHVINLADASSSIARQ